MEASRSTASVGAAESEDLLWLKEADLSLLENVGGGASGVVFTAVLVGRVGPVCAKVTRLCSS